MDIGKVIKIHNIPDPHERPVRYYPSEPNPWLKPEPKETPIPVPDWPVRVPEKVGAEK